MKAFLKNWFIVMGRALSVVGAILAVLMVMVWLDDAFGFGTSLIALIVLMFFLMTAHIAMRMTGEK